MRLYLVYRKLCSNLRVISKYTLLSVVTSRTGNIINETIRLGSKGGPGFEG